jgi:hypothetical protein
MRLEEVVAVVERLGDAVSTVAGRWDGSVVGRLGAVGGKVQFGVAVAVES